MDKNQQYWASMPVKDIGDEILDRVEKYYRFLSLSGRLGLYKKSYAQYNRADLTGGRLGFAGDQGELSVFTINHYKNIIQHLEALTLSQKIAFEPQATNSDMKSMSQTILSKGLLEYYLREKKLNRNVKTAVKTGLQLAESFVLVMWDPSAGDLHGQDNMGNKVQSGDVVYKNFDPLNVVRDYTKTSAQQENWWIFRGFENKYDLAAKFPDLKDDILSDNLDMLQIIRTTTLNDFDIQNSDQIAVYTLIHQPSPALPTGRFTKCLNSGVVLQDGPIPPEVHICRLACEEKDGSVFGNTIAFDLLNAQEAIDILYSTAITNQSTFGVSNVLTPKGSDFSTSQLSGGLNVLEYDAKVGKPEVLNLTSTPPEIFNFMQQIEALMERLSGLNGVVTGHPEASLKSGAALALVAAQAIQFSMNLQESYAALVEDIGTATIKILQFYAQTPRVAAIVGKSNRPYIKEFTGQDLDRISRVTVDLGNPLTNTIAGKINIAEAAINYGLIENMDQYLQVLTTGQFDPAIQGKQAESLLIKAENENLTEGKPQMAIITDDHKKHALEHRAILASPEARQDPVVLQATLDHIQQHLNFLKTADPALLALFNEQSMAPMGVPPTVPQQAPKPGEGPVQEVNGVQTANMPNAPKGTPAQLKQIIQSQK